MTVTVGIPTTGERPTLRRTVEAVIRSASLAGQDAEVLVVVNGRDDAPGLGRIDSPLLRVTHLRQRNVSAARNYAIDHASHDTLMFCDDDGIVPEQWCSELHAALTGRDWDVVTAPVRVPVSGPVTALVNYQRIFDPPPAGPDEAHVLTGNCGLRRSRIPAQVRYDEAHLPTAAEDVGFSFALRKAGLKIHWLGDATPGLHDLPEGIEEVTDRGVRYGRGGARLYLLRGNKKMAVPGALSWYASMASGEYREYRRFPEFIWPEVRVAFTMFEYMLNCSLLLGYLDELGTELGHRLVDLDYAALSAQWREIAAREADRARWLSAADWGSPPADYGRLERGIEAPDPAEAIAASVARALARHAPLTGGQVPEQVLRVLDPAGPGGPADARSGPSIAAQSSAGRERLATAWAELRQAGGPADSAELERCVRCAGMPFRRGGQELESLLRATRTAPTPA